MSYNQAKRIPFTPTETSRLIIDRFHEKTGKPRSVIVSELLHEISPVLLDMIDAIDKLEKRPELAQARLQSFIDEAKRQNKQLEIQIDELIKKPKGRRMKREICQT